MSITTETIKDKLGVAEVIGSYIKLDKAGANFKARCPFHNEKTPSFFVSTSRNSFYCFGCGAKGDIFSFVERLEGVDFMGALKILADRAGVPLKLEPKEITDERERLFGLMEKATLWFENNLLAKRNQSVVKYLLGRGLNQGTINTWRLGLAPADWRQLKTEFLGQGYIEKELLAVGLIKKTEEAKDSYDTFRGRITFPISDASGRVVAFSGRIVIPDDKAPKYLNSPDTALFRKSDILYGLHLAKTAIRRLNYAILVEGQMDLVMSHQAGIANTVATSGTALTSEQTERLRKLSKRIIMAFDPDPAGFRAANRNALLALSLGMEVKVAALPEGVDPADLIKQDPKSYREVLASAKHLIDFYLDNLLGRSTDPKTIAREVKEEILPYIAMLKSAVDRSQFINTVAKRTGLKDEALWEDLKTVKPKAIDRPTESAPQVAREREESNVGRTLLGVVYWQEFLEKPWLKPEKLLKQLTDICGKTGLEELRHRWSSNQEALIFEAEKNFTDVIQLERELSELLINFEREWLSSEFNDAKLKLRLAENANDSVAEAKWLKHSKKLSEKLASLERKREKAFGR